MRSRHLLTALFAAALSAQDAPQPAPVPADTIPKTPAAETTPVKEPEAAPAAQQEAGLPAYLPPPRDMSVPPPPRDPNDFTVSSDVEVVLLDVSVKDSNGGFASGLTKDKFRVLEDGKQQPITIFSAQDIPVTVGLVVDYSGSVRPKRPEVITAALTFVQRSHPQDEVFVVNFNDTVKLGLPENTKFTDDIVMLRSALMGGEMRGRTSLYDGLKLALKHLEDGRRDKKTLVLIADGGDNMSETTEDEIFRLAEESAATIYTVGIYNPDDKDKNPGFLRRLANLTGGEYFEPGSIDQLVPVCEKIAKDIRNRYTIGYVPSNREFDGKVRKIRVLASAADRGKLSVRTRTHYVAARDEFARAKHKH